DETRTTESAFEHRPVGGGARVLFDAAHGQMAGNADWVIDADACNHVPRFPTPSSREIAAAARAGETPHETTWSGAFSAFGVALASSGFELESLPPGERFTFGSVDNPQVLSGYDVLVAPEPNTPLS